MASKYPKTKQALFDYVENIFIEKLKILLRVEGLRASKRTENSLKAKNAPGLAVYLESRNNKGYEILQIINEGAKKFGAPPPADSSYDPGSDSIMKWMEAKRITPKDPSSGRFVKSSPENKRKSAFLIARSIKNNGIIKRYNGGSKIIQKTFNVTERKFDNTVTQVFVDELADRIMNGKKL